jgi:glycosyltransferase involved in cell wall biosynthesis
MVNQRKINKIAWVSSTLHTAGGGSRLLLEGVAYYRSLGIEVLVITWDFNEEALFDGRYSSDNIVEIGGSQDIGNSLTSRALRRLKTVKTLRSKLKTFKPDIVFTQSEYDVTLLRMAMIGTRTKHATFVFGQMFQFPSDLAKYAYPFNRHLNEIRLSTSGYREFISPKRPPSRFVDIFLAQAIAIPRYFAVRSSLAVFVFSKQVQWEVSKIYGVKADIMKGAFPRMILGEAFTYDGQKLKSKTGETLLLSLSRLIEKKRVALKIRALDILVHQRGKKNFRLIIGGKGAEMERLKELVSNLDLTDHVTFLGYVPEHEVYPLTAACDVYLSLDVADFDISPYEALAMKRKIVWSSEMDMDEYLSSCGAIFPVEPLPDLVADAIENAMSKPDASIDWSGQDRYSWETYFENIRQIVEKRS